MNKAKILLESLELQKKFIENNYVPAIASMGSDNLKESNVPKDIFGKLGEEIKEYQNLR